MIHILLADDQTLVRQGIRQLLEVSADLRVTREAADGEAALEALSRESFDLALLDVRMPKLTGLQVVQRLRRAGGRVPVILLTTFDDEGVLREGMKAGIA